MDMEYWSYKRKDGIIRGPFEEDLMSRWTELGAFSERLMIRKEGTNQFLPLAEVRPKFALSWLKAQKSQEAEVIVAPKTFDTQDVLRVSSSYIWIIDDIPIIIMFGSDIVGEACVSHADLYQYIKFLQILTELKYLTTARLKVLCNYLSNLHENDNEGGFAVSIALIMDDHVGRLLSESFSNKWQRIEKFVTPNTGLNERRIIAENYVQSNFDNGSSFLARLYSYISEVKSDQMQNYDLIKQNQEDVAKELGDVWNAIKDVKAEHKMLKEDHQNLKEEVGILKEDVGILKCFAKDVAKHIIKEQEKKKTSLFSKIFNR